MWTRESTDFHIDHAQEKWRGLDWLVITGRHSPFYSSWLKYIYFDDAELYRPCDLDSTCWPGRGQICPTIAVQSPPARPFVVKNIDNATSLRLRIAAVNGPVLVDTTFENRNGMPEWYWPGEILGNAVASGTYVYDLTLQNACGGIRQTDEFTVLNGIYDTLAYWVDTSAAWSKVPTPCCLHNLTLVNQVLEGDLDYIVKDSIIVNNVSVAAGSDILLQAGQNIELTNFEADSTVTNVEIIEAPCQGCRMAPPRGYGAFVTAGKKHAWPVFRSAVEGAEALERLAPGIRESAVLNSNGESRLLVKVFPNPVRSDLFVSIEGGDAARVELKIEILDGMGRLVGRFALRTGINRISTAALSHGIYFYRVLTEKRVIDGGRIMISDF